LARKSWSVTLGNSDPAVGADTLALGIGAVWSIGGCAGGIGGTGKDGEITGRVGPAATVNSNPNTNQPARFTGPLPTPV
jgi:hypothetical protein